MTDQYSDSTIAGNQQQSGQSSEGGGEGVEPSNQAVGGYTEEGDFTPDPTAMTGTLDTTGVSAGPHEDLRNVTQSFNAADARVATALEEGKGAYPEIPDEGQRQTSAEALRTRSGTTEGETALETVTSRSEGQGPQEVPHAVNENPAAGGDSSGGSAPKEEVKAEAKDEAKTEASKTAAKTAAAKSK